MCVFLSKIILTDSNLFFYLYAFLGNPQLLIITPNQEEIVLIKNGFSVALAKIIVENYKKFYKINFHDCSYELNEDIIDEMKKNKENGIIIYETRGNII